jgi:hypothetical protein
MASPLLRPEHVGWVAFTEHADEKLDDLPVDRRWVINQTMHLTGELYWEETSRKWDLYSPRTDLTIKFALDAGDVNEVVAVVVTVFAVDEPSKRYRPERDRFERYYTE